MWKNVEKTKRWIAKGGMWPGPHSTKAAALVAEFRSQGAQAALDCLAESGNYGARADFRANDLVLGSYVAFDSLCFEFKLSGALNFKDPDDRKEAARILRRLAARLDRT